MRITSCRLGEPICCPDSMGDLWATAWGDDDVLYCVSDDTSGFNSSCKSNLAINKLIGEPPDLTGETINPMSEYGTLGETRQDGGMWKACGIACIEGALLISVSRHVGGGLTTSPYPIQEAWDSSIVTSRDKARTWSRMPSIGESMFPGRTFATPSFVSYGKDGAGEADGADAYVYAVSSNGVWNNGSGMTLGRVRRDWVKRLEASNWEFIVNWEDGEPVWGPRHDTARLIFWRRDGASMTGIHHIEPLGLYIMPQWYHTHLEVPEKRWKATCFELYQAPKPWGPWEMFHTQRFEPEGWYNPYIPNKFISDDGKRFWMFVAGDWTTAGKPDGYYKLFMMPVEVEAG